MSVLATWWLERDENQEWRVANCALYFTPADAGLAKDYQGRFR